MKLRVPAACSAAIAMGVILGGCAGSGIPESASLPAQASKRAGVISLLGERPEYVQLAAPPSTAGEGELEPAQGWETDFFVETVVGRRLAASGYQLVAAGPVNRPAFEALASFRPQSTNAALDITPARGALAAFVAREKLDLLVVVTPSKLPAQYAGSLAVHGGYGKWGQGAVSGCFAAIRLTFLDVKDLRVTRQEVAARVSRKLDESLQGRRLGQISKTQRGELQDCMFDSLETLQDGILVRMGY